LQEKIDLEISNQTNNKEFFFIIKNYREENNEKILTDIDLEFCIELELTDEKFPVEFKIYDCSNEKEVLEAEKIKISKDIEFKNKYKLVVLGKENQLSKVSKSDVDINIKVYGKYNYIEKVKAFLLKRKITVVNENVVKPKEEYVEADEKIEINDSINIPIVEIEKEENKGKVDINYTIERVN